MTLDSPVVECACECVYDNVGGYVNVCVSANVSVKGVYVNVKL